MARSEKKKKAQSPLTDRSRYHLYWAFLLVVSVQFGGAGRLCGVLLVWGCTGCCPDPSVLEESSLRLQRPKPLTSRDKILCSMHWELTQPDPAYGAPHSPVLCLVQVAPECLGILFCFCILVLSIESRQGFAPGRHLLYQ